MSVTLEELVQAARETTARQRSRLPERELRARAEGGAAAAPTGRFREALSGPRVSLIAEVKGASPTAGRLRRDFDPVELARCYADNAAAAISVLTEERHFAGSVQHLVAVADEVTVPVLRKDFIVGPYQIYQAAVAGAAAVLLIAEVLSAAELGELVEVARSVGLDALVEVHYEASVPTAIGAGSGIIGVNNRNLKTMEVDVGHAVRLAGSLPRDATWIAESGIESPEQLRSVAQAGYEAALVGSSLVRADDPGRALRELLAGARQEVPRRAARRGRSGARLEEIT